MPDGDNRENAPSGDDLFSSLPDPSSPRPLNSDEDPGQPGSRRAAREARERSPQPEDQTPATPEAPAHIPQPPVSGAHAPAAPVEATPPRETVNSLESLLDSAPDRGAQKKEQRRGRGKGCLVLALILLVILGGIGLGGLWVAQNYGAQIADAMGWGPSKDYEPGEATGEALVTIKDGDTGAAISRTLFEEGVTKTENIFYTTLLKTAPNTTFYAGVYKLQKKMTADAALALLKDPATKQENTVLVTEGVSYKEALKRIADGTDIPLADLEKEAANFTSFGVPKEAPSIEGYLFPATYTFDKGVTAKQAIQRMVDETFARLDKLGVAPADRHRTLTMAGLVQREAGPHPDDLPKIARVFENRLDIGQNLESDATVAYGTGRLDSVWTTPQERADASNIYNTYANPGLPPGPIGLPGEGAIEAALHPAKGDWLFFVPVNLQTGETVFTRTFAEHQRAVNQLDAWCRESAENLAYCK